MVQLEYLAHSSFRLTSGGTSVLFDPYGPEVGYKLPYRRADVTLVSHNHFDHNHVAGVEGRTSVVRSGVPRKEKDAVIRGVLANHDNEGGSRLGLVTCFVVSLGGLTFCHLSDLGHTLDAATVREIGPVDVLMVPTGGGGYTIGPAEAVKVIDALSPRLVLPMHYQTPFLDRTRFPALEPIEAFRKLYPDARTDRSGTLKLAPDLQPGVCCLSHLC